jgi:ubiquinone/menaquinone biosynthesis C-methylase UbiE
MRGKKYQGHNILLYDELAKWFHLLTAPEDYKEEAEFYHQSIVENCSIPVETVIELGSGGGNNASHLKAYFKMTLTDLSSKMLDISRKINPECEHIQGDMKSMRLKSEFDAVFTQDAISYMVTEADLAKAMKTAYTHCRPGGVALFAPDYIQETFNEGTKSGGHDADGVSLRYMDWTRDPDKKGKSYQSHFVITLRQGNKVKYFTDDHIFGLFPEKTWLSLMKRAGFINVKAIPYPEKMQEESVTPIFVGNKPK